MNSLKRYGSNGPSGRTSIRLTRNTARQTFTARILSILTLGLVSSSTTKATRNLHSITKDPARISVTTQFERTVRAVSTAVTKAETVQALHAETMQQLDATEYALHRLFDEIHSVMPGFEKPVYNNAVVRVSEAEVFHPEALAA